MCARKKQPFEYASNQEFQGKLVEWVGDVLYDILPEYGYEVRDEQIFTAFQMADAICEKKVHLAEAGLGTGKTFAYLLSAIAYARFTRKPVVIACATTALQEQLAGPEGDIQTLSRLLNLEIDARMAKNPHQYICDVRVNESREALDGLSDEVEAWLSVTKQGERSEVPTFTDTVWKKMKWEPYMPCDTCMSRGYCKLVKAREVYRQTEDLLIVDHETFFRDLWTRKERLDNGQLPILPEYAAVIFDEGHKVLLPASMQAGQHISRDEIESMIIELEELQGARDSLVSIGVKMEDHLNDFFTALEQAIIKDEGAERVSIQRSETLMRAARHFRNTLDELLVEMQIEQELYSEALSPTQIQAYEAQIEGAIGALSQFNTHEGKGIVAWVEQKDGSFWVVPKGIKALLEKHLFKCAIPVLFVSATLSQEGNFEYFIRKMGLKQPSHSTIGSPFDLENQMEIHLLEPKDKIACLAQALKENGGRALVLTHSLEEMKKIRKGLKEYDFPFEIIWEDQGERGYLVRKFREEETSVLVGSNFWEGIDIPGEALTLLVIWELPLGIKEPLIEMQRKEAIAQGLDPMITVDYPEMALKLKQGCGRLIRTEEDKGMIMILDPVKDKPWENYVVGALPVGAKYQI